MEHEVAGMWNVLCDNSLVLAIDIEMQTAVVVQSQSNMGSGRYLIQTGPLVTILLENKKQSITYSLKTVIGLRTVSHTNQSINMILI